MIVQPPKRVCPSSDISVSNINTDSHMDNTENFKKAFDQNNSQNEVIQKSELKKKLKAEIKKKFIIGRKYILKDDKNSRNSNRIFILKKFVYSIEDRATNILIMKQISGVNMSIGCLTKHDCLLLHIKYEPGLQVWPMFLKWRLLKENNNDNKETNAEKA